MLARRQAHIDCPARPKELILFHRETGARGAEAQALLQQYKEEKMPQLWEERLKKQPLLPNPISPLPKTPIRLKTPLEKVHRHYPEKRIMYSPSEATPNKRSKLNAPAEDLDLQHDPVEISLEQPDEVFVVSPDPRLKGVYFGTPEKLSDCENEREHENKLKKESIKNIIMDITDLMEIKEVTYTNIKDTHEESNIDLSNNNQQKDSCDNDDNNKLKEKTRDKNSKDSESKEGARKDQSKIHKKSSKNNSETKKESRVSKHENEAKKDKSKKDKKKDKIEVPTIKPEDTRTPEQIQPEPPIHVNQDPDNTPAASATHPSEHRSIDSEDFPYSSIIEDSEIYGQMKYDKTFNLNDLNLDIESHHSLMRHMLQFKHKDATPYVPVEVENVQNKAVVQKLVVETYKKLQQTQEERVVLNIGGQCFQTSRVTLRADPTSLFGVMLREGCPLRPSSMSGRSTYFFDRDPAHFRFILNYLRNGAMLDASTLPRERRYLMELLTEVRFYRLSGLEDIVQARLRQVTGKNEQY